MKLTALLTTLGLATVNGQTTDPVRKFKHLAKVYPQMLDLFFNSPSARNVKGAARVAERFKANFGKKHVQLQAMWDECPEADLGLSMMRIDENIRFDKQFAKKAIHQITNGYRAILEALVASNCPKVNRYERMDDRFEMIGDMLKFHYCDKVDADSIDWCKKWRSNPRHRN